MHINNKYQKYGWINKAQKPIYTFVLDMAMDMSTLRFK